MAQIIIKIDDDKKKIIQDTAKSEFLSLSAFMKKLSLDYSKRKMEASSEQNGNSSR